MAGGKIVIIGEDIELQSVHGLHAADVIITFDLSDEVELKSQNLPALYFHRYAQSKKVWHSTIASARKWLEDWPGKPLHDGKSFLDIFRFEDTSLWWFVYDAIWETKNGMFDSVYYAKSMTALVQDYKPGSVELWGSFDFGMQELADALAKMFGFDLKLMNYVPKSKLQNELTRPAGKLKLLTRFVLLKAARALAGKGKGRPMAFFLNHGTTAVEKYRDGAHIISDHYLEGLESCLVGNKPRKIIVSMNMPNAHSSQPRNILLEAFRTMKGLYVPWLCYSSISDLGTRRSLIGHYSNKLAEIENDPHFRESMVVDGIDIYPVFREAFRSNLPRALALVHSEILIARKFVKRERPNTVFHTTGLSPAGRALAFACNEQHTRIMAPQLGIISPELPVNTAFLITEKYDRRLLSEYLSWGPFYRELLAGRGYPEALAKVAGFWRTERIESKHRPPVQGEYVLYAAGANLGKLSYILSLDEEIVTIKMIRKVIPNTMGLVVKLHPSLPYDTYRDALHDIINEITLVGGPGAPGIEEFLSGAKVVVGKASTVLVQALILKIPVIAANFGSEVNFLGYQGVPFAASPEEFKENVKAILEGKSSDFDLDFYCSPIGAKSASLVGKELENERQAKSSS